MEFYFFYTMPHVAILNIQSSMLVSYTRLAKPENGEFNFVLGAR
jgi:hypothetical protein